MDAVYLFKQMSKGRDRNLKRMDYRYLLSMRFKEEKVEKERLVP
jgi:hypothetical protein